MDNASYTWTGTFELRVAACWVADGFNLTPERLQEMLERAIAAEMPYAHSVEYSMTGTITNAPDAAAIREEQGEVPVVCNCSTCVRNG